MLQISWSVKIMHPFWWNFNLFYHNFHSAPYTQQFSSTLQSLHVIHIYFGWEIPLAMDMNDPQLKPVSAIVYWLLPGVRSLHCLLRCCFAASCFCAEPAWTTVALAEQLVYRQLPSAMIHFITFMSHTLCCNGRGFCTIVWSGSQTLCSFSVLQNVITNRFTLKQSIQECKL